MLSLLLALVILTGPASPVAPTPPGSLLCSYDGELYAHPTVEREYRDAHRVVRGRVVAVKHSVEQPGASSDDAPWTRSTIRVLETFKGEAVNEFSLFTWRDSGAFYTDDVGGEYLLFADPHGFSPAPPDAGGAMSVNYCGNSRPWGEVPPADHRELRRLSAG